MFELFEIFTKNIIDVIRTMKQSNLNLFQQTIYETIKP